MRPEPGIRFMLGGVQKGGTTALASYLAAHPQLVLPQGKESHVFDAPDFDDAWGVAQVDARFAEHFPRDSAGKQRGDATPITLFGSDFIARTFRYNPSMRWIVLLRDPVERAISHYFMERGRGHERLPLALAVLLENVRLRHGAQDWSAGSALRRHSYIARGRYAAQLDVLLQYFPRSQVLLLRSSDLAKEPEQVVTAVLHFLGVAALSCPAEYLPVFEGGYRRPGRWSLGRQLLRLALRGEKHALRQRYGVDLDLISSLYHPFGRS